MKRVCLAHKSIVTMTCEYAFNRYKFRFYHRYRLPCCKLSFFAIGTVFKIYYNPLKKTRKPITVTIKLRINNIVSEFVRKLNVPICDIQQVVLGNLPETNRYLLTISSHDAITITMISIGMILRNYPQDYRRYFRRR